MTTDPKNDPADEGPRDFSRFLQTLAEGDAHTELSEDLHALGQALITQAKAQHKDVSGELVLKLKFQADPKGIVAARYEITRKDPAPARAASVLWITKGGNFTEQNPQQQVLPLRDVGGGRAAPRDLDQDQAAAKEV